MTVKNINLSTTAATPGTGIAAFAQAAIEDCSLTGFAAGISTTVNTILTLINTSIACANGSTNAISGSVGTALIAHCFISGGSGTLLSLLNAVNVLIAHSVIANGSIGIQVSTSGNVTLLNCTLANHSNSAVFAGAGFTGSFRMQSCIVYGNGNTGLRTNSASQKYAVFVAHNAWGSNTSGNYSTGIPAGAGDVTLTADPFTNSGSRDYSLNSTAGGGAACKGTGFPGAFPGGTTTGYLDIGAVQSNASGGGSTPSNYSFFA